MTDFGEDMIETFVRNICFVSRMADDIEDRETFISECEEKRLLFGLLKMALKNSEQSDDYCGETTERFEPPGIYRISTG